MALGPGLGRFYVPRPWNVAQDAAGAQQLFDET